MTSVVRNIKLAISCESVPGHLTVRKIVLFPYLNANNIPKVNTDLTTSSSEHGFCSKE